jgi:hypothetical protein
MIYLKNDFMNKVPLTLSESFNISQSPSFLFKFTREWNKDVHFYKFTDVSNAPSIFNLFNITLSSTASATQSLVNDPINIPSGQYYYEIFDNQIYVNDGYVLPNYTTSSLQLLEVGMLIVEHKVVDITPQNIYL